MPSKNPGRGSTGGSRPVAPRPTVNERPAPFEPDPRVLALLRSIWGRRDKLRQSQREIVFSFLRQARERRLTDAQLDTAASIGRQLPIGFDDPRLDDPPAPAPAQKPKAQPWGPLPLRPPTRSANGVP